MGALFRGLTVVASLIGLGAFVGSGDKVEGEKNNVKIDGTTAILGLGIIAFIVWAIFGKKSKNGRK